MHKQDLIRQAAMLVLFSAVAALAHYASQGEPTATVIRALTVGSYSVLAMAAVLYARVVFFGHPKVKDLPHLSVQSIVLYVYGLGILAFVTVYCLLDLSVAKYFFLATLCGLSAGDVLERESDSRQRRALTALANALCFASFVLKGSASEDAYEAVDALVSGRYFVAVLGFLLPAFAPIIFLALRNRRHCNPVTVMELIHISMPVAVHTAVTTLLSVSLIAGQGAGVQPPHNATAAEPNASGQADLLLRTGHYVTASDLATPALALAMLPVLFFALQTVLARAVGDLLCPVAVVAAFRHFAERQDIHASTVFIFLTASGAFVARVYVCYMDSDDPLGPGHKHPPPSAYTDDVDLDDLAGSEAEV